MGQLLGAGVGPGGSMQSLDVTWFRGMKTLGVQVERVVHNQDYYYYTYTNSQDFRRHWVDLGYAAVGSWDFNHLLINARVPAVKSLNYQWFLFQQPGEPYWIKGRDKFNIHAKVGVSYFF